MAITLFYYETIMTVSSQHFTGKTVHFFAGLHAYSSIDPNYRDNCDTTKNPRFGRANEEKPKEGTIENIHRRLITYTNLVCVL